MQGLILSGGKGTRLGPLGLQRAKCLVTVGSKPMLVRQYQLLRDSGCDEVTVVVSPDAVRQVLGVVESAHLEHMNIVVQKNPFGPVDALLTGLTQAPVDKEVRVLFADTLLDPEDMPHVSNSVVLGSAPKARDFCRYQNGTFYEAPASKGDLVCIGAYQFKVEDAERAAFLHKYDDYMAGFLNEFEYLAEFYVPSWQDVGDIESLTDANRNHFISRSFNDVTLTTKGTILKKGDVFPESLAVQNPPEAARHMYPSVYRSLWTQEPPLGYYEMEYVPLPTLAELYLYWPREPDMWRHITKTLVTNLAEYHWPVQTNGYPLLDVSERAYRMYVPNLTARYAGHDTPAPHRCDVVDVNGEHLVTGKRLLRSAISVGESFAEAAEPAILHGDPNFTNVLWSLETSTFRLVDPRGEWGGSGSLGDRAYDVGKIAYSPIFARIAHGLFDIKQLSKHAYELTPLHLDPVISEQLLPYVDGDWAKLQQLAGWLLLAGAPLHQGKEATAMYLTGARLLQEWI